MTTQAKILSSLEKEYNMIQKIIMEVMTSENIVVLSDSDLFQELKGFYIPPTLAKNNPSEEEIFIFYIALFAYINPYFINHLMKDDPELFAKIAGKGLIYDSSKVWLIPTAEFAVKILAGNDTLKRLDLLSLFSDGHYFKNDNILYLAEGVGLVRELRLNPSFAFRLFSEAKDRPSMSTSFPAEFIDTKLEWEDLILPKTTRNQINELEIWLNHNDELMKDWGMGSHVKPGYKVLFYGPSGTGKTLTATLLGKYTGKDVFKVDLSMVVSKYIGETEKNLSNLFDQAANKNWILFFDEADALFGKRTSVNTSHDRYANQEVSYLLQRLEMFPGLVILASNLKSNIDTAFSRRFSSVIQFSIPKSEERLILWKKALPKKLKLASNISLKEIAFKYELTGANIINVIHYCVLQLIHNKKETLGRDDLMLGIKREYLKEERVW